MMMKVMLVLMVFLLASAVSAFTDYNQSGREGNQYILGDGIFNENFISSELITKTAILSGSGKKAPLVADLDGNGIKEILVLDGNVLKTFINNESKPTILQTQPGFTFPTAGTETYSNMLIFDIDGDNKGELIAVAEFTGQLYILDYDAGVWSVHAGGSDGLGLKNNQDIGAAGLNNIFGTDGGEVVIQCWDVDECAMAYASESDTGFPGSPDDADMSIVHFSSTNVTVSGEILLANSFSFATYCQPKIRHMFAGQLDADADVELAFTVMRVLRSSPGPESIVTWVVDHIPGNDSFSEKHMITDAVDDFLDAGGSGTAHYSCKDAAGSTNECSASNVECLAGDFFSAPLVFNADPSNSGNELIVAYNTDEDEFIMNMYESTGGTSVREFPLLQESEGQIVSDVFRADIFDDSDDTDFCVLGFEGSTTVPLSDNALVMTCGSLTDNNGFGAGNLQTIEFRLDVSNLFNLTRVYDFHTNLVHSAQHKSTNAPSEIVTTYGILEPLFTTTSCTVANNCFMQRIYTLTESNGAVITVDYEGDPTLTQNDDFVVMRQNNLYYLDNGLINQPLSSVTSTTNPCLDAIIKINSTFSASVTATDPEGDDVHVDIFLYFGTSNEQSFSINTSSGTVVTFEGIFNQSGSGNYRYQAYDLENPTTVRGKTIPYTVGAVGVEFGDCTQITSDTLAAEEAAEEGAAGPQDPGTNSSLGILIGQVNSSTGLGSSVIWWLLMVIIAFVLAAEMGGIFSKFGASDSSIFGITLMFILGIVELLMLFIGVKLGFIGIGSLIVLSLIGVGILALVIKKFQTGAAA